MELNYLYGSKITKEIKEGRAIHESIEDQINIPIVMQPKSYADFLYKSLYTSYVSISNLRSRGKCREVQMYGSANGYKLVGRIDQLELDSGKVVISEDKTKASFKLPTEAQLKTNKIQLLVYRKMLEDIVTGGYGIKNFSVGYSTSNLRLTEEFIRQLNAMGVEQVLQTVPSISMAFFGAFSRLGALSDTMKLRYLDQITGDEIKIYTFEYNKEETNEAIKHVLKYWNGERKAAPVPEGERWKCNFCVFFGKECKVWWQQKELDA
jgi:exonuclease V